MQFRNISKYKNKETIIDSLFLTETYSGYLALSKNVYERENTKIINKGIKKTVSRIFGKNRPICVVEKDLINLNELLPEIIVYAWLTNSEPISEGDGSHLILVWFQDSGQDPFVVAKEKIEKIIWEKEAKDFAL